MLIYRGKRNVNRYICSLTNEKITIGWCTNFLNMKYQSYNVCWSTCTDMARLAIVEIQLIPKFQVRPCAQTVEQTTLILNPL